MINIKNITKVLLLAMFICVCSFDANAQPAPKRSNTNTQPALNSSNPNTQSAYNVIYAISEDLKNNYKPETSEERLRRVHGNATGVDIYTGGKYQPTGRDFIMNIRDDANKAAASKKGKGKSGSSQGTGKSGSAKGSSKSSGGGSQPKVIGDYETDGSEIYRENTSDEAPFTINSRLPVVSSEAVSTISSNIKQDSSFCGSDKGVFGELVTTGITIFKGLRDLIYVVAGFGIIAVAVGGFFGNMNWKWLSAIVLALIVIASAGELIVLLTGCEQYGTTLITNTLKAPTKKVAAQNN